MRACPERAARGNLCRFFLGIRGEKIADLASLVSSAHRSDLDVFVYAKDVLDRLLAGETDYHALRPDVWKQSHPKPVRIYRAEERLSRADAKAEKRTRRRGVKGR